MEQFAFSGQFRGIPKIAFRDQNELINASQNQIACARMINRCRMDHLALVGEESCAVSWRKGRRWSVAEDKAEDEAEAAAAAVAPPGGDGSVPLTGSTALSSLS